jgi:H/ACA ribonucleoprotein complex subunit 4
MDTNQLPFEKIKRTILTKKVSQTSDKYGNQFDNLPIEELLKYGIINLDKPKGPTSHQVSDYLKKIIGVSKAGHSGTLDPKVSGVLPTAIGRATRVVQCLLTSGKEYITLMHLHNDVSEKQIRKACNEFIGKIRQLPPIKSSVKRQLRYRKIYYLEILEIKGQDVLFKVGTQAGTYIRKLVHDIGQKIGCGAHMAELRRTKAGPFREDTLVTLQDVSDALHFYKEEGNEKYLRKIIQPIENGVQHLAKVWIMDSTVDTLCHGASLKIPGIVKVESDIQVDDPIAIMTLKNELVAFGKALMISKEMISNERGIAMIANKVFMLPGVYPKIERKIKGEKK